MFKRLLIFAYGITCYVVFLAIYGATSGIG